MAGSQLLPPLSAPRRLPDANARLRALLAQRWAAPFEWGSNDCCLFAADALLAQTGQDPAAAWRGKYHTAAEAGHLMRRVGGLQALASATLGAPLRGPLFARLGDIGLTDSGTLVVCLGEVWAGPGRRGLVLMPLASAVLAWRVGHG